MKRIVIIIIMLALLGVITVAFMRRSQSHTATKTATNAQKANNENLKSTSSPASPTPAAGFDAHAYSVTDPTSPWVVVNKQHPLSPADYAPADLATIGNGQLMQAEAAASLTKMFSAASGAGYSLVADSGYRSYDTQVATYNSEVKAYGQTVADNESARPGYSEHQTGWAVDIGSGNCHVDDCFGDLPAGQWAQQNAYRFGFILRYTPADTNTTGYRAEAWHFRYVGVGLASELHTKNIATLEQFFGVSGGTTYN